MGLHGGSFLGVVGPVGIFLLSVVVQIVVSVVEADSPVIEVVKPTIEVIVLAVDLAPCDAELASLDVLPSVVGDVVVGQGENSQPFAGS